MTHHGLEIYNGWCTRYVKPSRTRVPKSTYNLQVSGQLQCPERNKLTRTTTKLLIALNVQCLSSVLHGSWIQGVINAHEDVLDESSIWLAERSFSVPRNHHVSVCFHPFRQWEPSKFLRFFVSTFIQRNLNQALIVFVSQFLLCHHNSTAAWITLHFVAWPIPWLQFTLLHQSLAMCFAVEVSLVTSIQETSSFVSLLTEISQNMQQPIARAIRALFSVISFETFYNRGGGFSRRTVIPSSTMKREWRLLGKCQY